MRLSEQLFGRHNAGSGGVAGSVERASEHSRPDATRHAGPWRPIALVAVCLSAWQAALICWMWAGAFASQRRMERDVAAIWRDMSTMMMISGDLQDRLEAQDKINRAVSDWMLEASKDGKRTTNRGDQ